MNVALLKATWQAFNEDKAQRLAAAIAYSTIFSIAPLLILVVAIVGGILDVGVGHGGHRSTLNALLAQVRQSAGPGAADTVKALIEGSFNKPKQGLIAQILGWIFFILGASGLFAALQDALNAIWHVEATKGGIKQILRDRIASFGMILVVGFLMLVTFAANATISFVSAHFLNAIPFAANPIVVSTIDQIISIAIVTVIFALIYKVLPDVNIAWRDVWIGAGVTAVLFVVGEALIGLYIAHGGIASAYGAAGSLLVALIWIYYSALILLLGAEFTKVYATDATLTVPATIRHVSDQPAGVDPRKAAVAATSAAATSAAGKDERDAAAPSPPDAATIRAQIEETRERLAGTAEALAYKVDVPSRLKHDVAQRVDAVKSVLGVANDGTRPVRPSDD
jgi:membrane protein